MKRLVYRPEAEADVRAAFDWYENQREGLGAEFLDELTRAEEKVLTTPLAFRVLRRDARRLLLRRFPYQLSIRWSTMRLLYWPAFTGDGHRVGWSSDGMDREAF